MTKHLWFALALLLAACGGPAATDDEDGADTAGGDDGRAGHRSARELIGVGPPAVPWSEMSHADREMDMIGRFLPIMTEVFQEHDAEEYAAFGCESCHGADMREREFHMPTAELPPVPPPGTPEYAAMTAEHPNDVRFMEEEVTPVMQTLLGMGATFTCNGCHPAPGATAATVAPTF